jgi:hypothetical protein
MAASAIAWSERNQTARAMDRADMDRLRDQFVVAAEMAARCGFDMLELHYAHGYLLSSFITPLTNRRTDRYGGSIEKRMRYPLEIFDAVRAVWPAEKPISVRISANDWVGRVLGTLTLTPYDSWRSSHNIHHASSGNLEQRGIGDITTLTVREYLELSNWRRCAYRFYRHPLVMFGLGPAYQFLVRHRLPAGSIGEGWRPWIGTMATNVAIALLTVAMMWLVGVGPFLLVHLPITMLAASIGVWLFYYSTSSKKRPGPRLPTGICTRRRCMAARITTFPASCAGSRPTSGCTTCITCAAAFRSTACRRCCATIPSFPASAGSLLGRASDASTSRFGTSGARP